MTKFARSWRSRLGATGLAWSPAGARARARVGEGRPKTDTAMNDGAVPAFPIPTAADQLPPEVQAAARLQGRTWGPACSTRAIRRARRARSSSHALRRQQVYAFRPQPHTQGRHRQEADGHRIASTRRQPLPATNTKIVRYDDFDANM